MKVIRHIHPIGQGAFYTERFVDDNNTTLANVVYDCGCGINLSKQAKKMIAASFSRNDVIDILFISHFDSDHINGIKILKENLRIRYVIMPLLTDYHDIILSLNTDEDLRLLIERPSDFFQNETKVYQIRDIYESEYYDYHIVLENKIFYNLDEDYIDMPYVDGKIISFQPITITSLKNFWIYLPFNYVESERKQQLKSILKKYNVKEKDLICCLKNLSIKKARDVFNELEGKTNGNSLCVYSGPQNVRINNVTTISNSLQNLSISILAGCLYLGDCNLNDKNNCDKTIIDYMMDIVQIKDYLKNIGLIQIPHHGSIKSFSNLIFSINPRCVNYFISYGHNTYGHPSDRVVEDTLYRKNILHNVNQQQESRLVQFIEFKDINY